MANEKLIKAAVSFRASLAMLMTDVTAFIRVLDEVIEQDEIPTIRPPSEQKMAAVKVEVVRFPEKGRTK